MKITENEFGVLSDGRKAMLYTLAAGDLELSLTNFGATWTSLIVPSGKKRKDDVLLGYSTSDGYINNGQCFGVTVGRFANRVKGACFKLNGKTFYLDKNDGENSLHGGRRGFDKLLWKAEPYEEGDGIFVRFELESPDGDRGYPGDLKAEVIYGLTKSNEIIADYNAKVSAPCPVNLTNHSYFNLKGEGEGDIFSHELLLRCSSYLGVDAELIPDGTLVPVKNTAFDFTTRKPIKADLKALGSSASEGGYDHCFVVDGKPGELRPCAEVYDPESGRSMKIATTQPGVQLYTGNMIPGLKGKAGSTYVKHSGFCLETQHFPDSPNRSGFPSCIFGPDRDYHEKSVFTFDF
jgi:aldose 1-epimerase